jgi:hypothetical protein
MRERGGAVEEQANTPRNLKGKYRLTSQNWIGLVEPFGTGDRDKIGRFSSQF